MRSFFERFAVLVIAAIILTGCGDKPKVISTGGEEQETTESSTGIFSEGGTKTSPSTEMGVNPVNDGTHQVIVEEVLYATKYVYANVTENGRKFWIATLKKEIEVGQPYFYRGGLLKTNFESKEHNRMFDTIYLVSNILPVNHDHSHDHTNPATSANEEDKGPRSVDVEGSVKIADLVANPEKYAGQTIQISGECTKINPNIMGINWIHLKDGSKDDFDLVITSDVMIPEGHVVTMTGTVTLNKDFGAGYRYDIILENGKIIQ